MAECDEGKVANDDTAHGNKQRHSPETIEFLDEVVYASRDSQDIQKLLAQAGDVFGGKHQKRTARVQEAKRRSTLKMKEKTLDDEKRAGAFPWDQVFEL